MRFRFVLVGLCVMGFLSGTHPAVAWSPAKGPLATRWAKQVSPKNVHAEYPRPQMVRHRWLNLNGLWEVTLDDSPEAKEILVPFPVESALSGVMEQAERLHYRREFRVPAAWRGSRILLHFEAVDWEATVSLNGRKLGTHRGGYDSFTFDITDALRSDGPQELVVDVFDPSDAGDQPRGKQVKHPKGIWYTPCSGIWQTVWLEPVPTTSISDLRLDPNLDEHRLEATVFVRGNAEDTAVRLTAQAGRKTVAEAVGKPGEPIHLDIPKEMLRPWSPDDPFLYDLNVELVRDGKEIDSVTSYFGMRKVSVAEAPDGFVRLHLNNKPLFMMGPLDQGFWPDGIYTAPTDEALRYDIEITKRLGFNMTRKHVKIEPKRWYYWCDKLGLLVWQDMPSGNNKSDESKKQFEIELAEMIHEHRNHPSIVMWVVFNEGWGQHDTENRVAFVRSLDPTRLIDNASGWTDKGVGDVLDIHRYPGPGAPEPDDGRAGVLGEFGGLGLAVPGHLWTQQNWGYRSMADADELNTRYIALMRRLWQLVETKGLAAGVYTQITDVETECNGLLTYDREVIKVDVDRIAAANRGHVPRLVTIVPTASDEKSTWRYTTETPADTWFTETFDDSDWSEGPGGFGTEGTPGAVVGTKWDGAEIWIRRTVELPSDIAEKDLVLIVHHDEDAEIYLNGVLAAKTTGYTTDYVELPLSSEAKAALKAGKNTIAVHCRQTEGGQFIDVGLAALETPQE
ncbi:MAG: glycoside hydrolase family 2 [Planctomycetota bacterium]|nr:MAG: glycoside hydrolase family 2 [Planctomycetota bacterium]